MKTVLTFRLTSPASEAFAKDCWGEFDRFLTRDSVRREYQIETSREAPVGVSLADEIGDVSNQVRLLADVHDNSVELLVAAHCVRGD